MNKLGWYCLWVLLLAACAPLQIGLEPGTATAVAAVSSTARAEATAGLSATPALSATSTPRATAVVSTVTPSPTPSVTATPTDEPPTATRRPPTRVPASATAPLSATSTVPAPQEPPEIVSFTADRTQADPGETITLSWTTRNAATVMLVTGVPDANGQLTFTELAIGLPPTGTFFAAIENIAPAQLFKLTPVDYAMSSGGPLQLSIARRSCSETYSFVFPAGRSNCAATASQLAPMVEQVFEHGRLVWLGANNWVNPRSQPIIFVMNSSGGWVSRTDTWVDGEPESDPAIVPPEGLHQPVRGFGKLWREEFRDMLGWAVAPEQHYTGAFQEGWAPQPGFETGLPGWYARDIYVRLANSDVVRFVWSSRFNGQTWELLPQ